MCWDYRCVSPCPAKVSALLRRRFFFLLSQQGVAQTLRLLPCQADLIRGFMRRGSQGFSQSPLGMGVNILPAKEEKATVYMGLPSSTRVTRPHGHRG
jgi:hypothetical protein